MGWEIKFLCPECGCLRKRIIAYETQLWSYWCNVETGDLTDPEQEETGDTIYKCPDCGEEVDLDYYNIEVDDERRVFRIPYYSYWADNIDAVRTLMGNRYGYRLEDDEWDEDTEENIDDVEGKDIFADQNEIWEV